MNNRLKKLTEAKQEEKKSIFSNILDVIDINEVILTNLDAKDTGSFTRINTQLHKNAVCQNSLLSKEVEKLLHHVALGELNDVKAMVEKSPSLLLQKGSTTIKHNGISFKNKTALQIALYTKDFEMVSLFQKNMELKDIQTQQAAQFPDGYTAYSELAAKQIIAGNEILEETFRELMSIETEEVTTPTDLKESKYELVMARFKDYLKSISNTDTGQSIADALLLTAYLLHSHNRVPHGRNCIGLIQRYLSPMTDIQMLTDRYMGRRKVFFWDGRNCINFFPMVSKPNTGLGFDYAIYQGRVSSTFPQIMVMFWDFPGEISILSRNEKMKGLILNPKSASIAPISSSTNNDILKEFEAELKNLEDNNIPHQIIHQISDLLLDIKKLQEEEIFINSNIKYHLDLKINLKIVMNKMKYFSQQNLVDVNEKELQDFNLVLTELNNIADKLQHRNSERFNYRKLLFALKKIIVSIMQCAVLLTIGIGMTGGTMGFSVGAIANSFGVVFSGGLFAPFAPAGFAACVVAGAIIGGFTGCMLGIALGLYTGYKELFDSQNTKNSIDNLVTSIKTSFITPAATFSSNLS